jgi:uncharacterized protein YcaQ
VTVARRNAQFERVYDLPERVLPAAVLAAPTPTVEEAYRTLVRASAAALGVATEPWLRDYFRLAPAMSQATVADLVDAGELVPVVVEGVPRAAYLWHQARVPRRVEASALLSPFDSLIFERQRTEQLFGYHYRIEIYVPAPKRVYGYYVYSFLYDERIAARVDLKADRQGDVLRVMAAYTEPTAPPDTAVRLLAELESMAGWLGLGGVTVEPRGDLAAALAAVNRSR